MTPTEPRMDSGKRASISQLAIATSLKRGQYEHVRETRYEEQRYLITGQRAESYGSTSPPYYPSQPKHDMSLAKTLSYITICILSALGLCLLVFSAGEDGTSRVTEWTLPIPDSCQSLGSRVFHAKLLNLPWRWSQATGKEFCLNTSIEIQGQSFEHPVRCEVKEEEVFGYWVLTDQSACRPYWNAYQSSNHCHSYDTREYRASLQNFNFESSRSIEICLDQPIKIDGQFFRNPDRCLFQDDLVRGIWLVKNQTECRPYWGPFQDKGCQASEKRRYEAELWQLVKGDDWYEMCGTTPANIHGIVHMPSYCDLRRGKTMTGVWDIEDPDCRN